MRRKTLRNAWRSVTQDREELERAATEAGVSLDVRGETLDVEAFARIASRLEGSVASSRP
jgi:16S rRNA (adenine1518-N6/adenine1519-N6)-dimethyltransferase